MIRKTVPFVSHQFLRKLYPLPMMSMNSVSYFCDNKNVQNDQQISKQILNQESQKVESRSTHTVNRQNYQIRCEGCNVRLQSQDKNKFGFISGKLLNQAIDLNSKNIKGVIVNKNRETAMLSLLHEVQKQTGVTIFDNKIKEPQNLNNLEVLMRLQQKIDAYEEQNQIANRSKKDRKPLICFRCFSLKYHNRLPEQYDKDADFTTSSTDFILNKAFNRHKQTSVQFFFLIDVLDILGTFPQLLFHRLLQQSNESRISLVVNKIDVVNKNYLDEEAIRIDIRRRMRLYLKKYDMESKEANIRIFFISCNSRDGFKKLQPYLQDRAENIQLIGMPNTGKTTLLNILAKLNKSTSRVPGTTVKITEHDYQVGKKKKIYDMPGLPSTNLLYNLIQKPSIRSLLTWHKKISPGLLTHSAFFYGGKVEIEGVRIIIFGNGGACSSNNRWFIRNFRKFWKGLPNPNQLKIVKHSIRLEFVEGRAEDLEIAGYGFMGFRLCIPHQGKTYRTLTLYLPQKVGYSFRPTILSKNDLIFHNKSALTKKYNLNRLFQEDKGDKKSLKW